jgi:hypothetical protein
MIAAPDVVLDAIVEVVGHQPGPAGRGSEHRATARCSDPGGADVAPARQIRVAGATP